MHGFFLVQFIETTLNDIIRNGPGIDELILSELTSRVMILNSVFRHRVFDKLYLDGQREEETLRQRSEYGVHVRGRLKELGITNVSDWQGRKAVDSSVILAYERSPALKDEFERDFVDVDHDGIDDRLVFLTRILTIAKMADDNFSPTHIFWLTRGQKYFPSGVGGGAGDRPVNGAEGSGSTKEDRALTVAYFFK